MAAVIVSIEYAGAPAGDEALRLLCRELRGRGVRAASVIRRDGPLYSGDAVSSEGLFDSGALRPEGPAVSDRVDKSAGANTLKSAPAERDFAFTAVTDGEKLIASGGGFSLERVTRLWPDTDAVLISGWEGPDFPTVDLARCAPDGGALSGVETNAGKPHVTSCGEAGEGKIHLGSGACAEAAERIIELGASSDPCWLPYARLASGADSTSGGVSLSIDGSKVALLPFVQDIIRQVNLGLISALKDTGSGKRIEIVIEPK